MTEKDRPTEPGFVIKLHNMLPGRTIRKNFSKRVIPPLWVWLRSSFYVILGTLLLYAGYQQIATILFTFAVIQLVAISLAAFFQELANGIKRYLGKQ